MTTKSGFTLDPKKNSQQKSSSGMNPSRPYRLNGRQFMQRWTMHILPKGFTRSRCYGGFHGSKRKNYLQKCGELLPTPSDESSDTETSEIKETSETTDGSEDSSNERQCPHCESALELIHYKPRPSWREIFERHVHENKLYCPHFHFGAAPPLGDSSSSSGPSSGRPPPDVSKTSGS